LKRAWDNDALWQIVTTEKDWDDFIPPYVGNGVLGVRFGPLVFAAPGEAALPTYTRTVYDGGYQRELPEWNRVRLTVGGVDYAPSVGFHRSRLTLDVRTGVVYATDTWTYKANKHVSLSTELFVPRGHGACAMLALRADDLEDEATLTFGIARGQEQEGYRASRFAFAPGLVSADHTTLVQSRAVAQAIAYDAKNAEAQRTLEGDGGAFVTLRLGKGASQVQFCHCAATFREAKNPLNDATKYAQQWLVRGFHSAQDASAMAWREMWRGALAFADTDDDTLKTLLIQQFYIMASLEKCDGPLKPLGPLGALGLSKNQWHGSQLWDADFWVFRAILPLWPDMARCILDFRYATLKAAREHARVNGYEGAWYPCVSDDEGHNRTDPRKQDAIHINIWIGLAVWEYYQATQDKAYFEKKGWPILSGVADFFASRALPDNQGMLHLFCVLGPDEYPADCGTLRVNDNFLTNYGAKVIMRLAQRAADVLGGTANPAWARFEEKIVLLAPDWRGIIPEYWGYSEQGIKQADVLLAFYPLDYPASEEIVRKNILYYRDKQMYYGPWMSSEIESCILMRMGDKAFGLKRLLDGMRPFLRGPHRIPFECQDLTTDNSVLLTGMAGVLQALIYGYYGCKLPDFSQLPRVGEWMGGNAGRSS